MGVYAVRHLKQALIERDSKPKDILVYANDFCTNVKDTVKERLILFNELYTLDPKSDKFSYLCIEKLNGPSEVVNPWYLPALPSEIMTITDTCLALEDMLF